MPTNPKVWGGWMAFPAFQNPQRLILSPSKDHLPVAIHRYPGEEDDHLMLAIEQGPDGFWEHLLEMEAGLSELLVLPLLRDFHNAHD